MFTPPFYLFIVLYGKNHPNVLIYLFFISQNVMIFIVREEIMKKKIILAVLMATMLTGCGKTIPTLEDGKQAVVQFEDGSMISVDDLYNEMKGTAFSTLMDMIDKKIYEGESGDKLDDAKEYAKNYVESAKQYYGYDKDGNYSESQLINYLQQMMGISSLEELEERARLSYLRQESIEKYVKDNLKDKEIEDYYKDEIVGDRDVYHIQIIPEVKSTMTDTEKTEAENAALDKAKDIITRLKKGESFEDLAKELSDDEATKEKGGSLGFINKGTYGSDDFDKEVYALKVGEFSNTPVKTSSGYEVVYVKEEKDKKSLVDAKDEIKDALATKKLTDDATLQITVIQDLRKKYGVDVVDTEIERDIERYMDNWMTSVRQQNSNSSSN